MNICIVGTGYVGLVTGTCFTEMGNKVYCVDVDKDKIDKINSGIMPIYEPGLKELVDKNVKEKRLFFTTNMDDGLKNALFCFIAVGTPPGEDGSADLSYVLAVAREIGQRIDKYTIIVNKSTVPVGTAELVRKTILAELTKRGLEHLEFDIVSNPEFLKEGVAIEDCLRPDRIVVGVDNVRTAELIKELYEPFMRNQNPILVMDIPSAELTKYAANAMLATRISFMNELAQLCDKVGADISHIRTGIGTDQRIGMKFLYAGCGYGGSCFPKDVQELIRTGERNGVDMLVSQSVEKVNVRQKSYLVELVCQRFGNNLAGYRFGIWGLSFKPQTDDMREAASLTIIEKLLELGAELIVYDPVAVEQAQKILGTTRSNLTFAQDMMDVVDDIDAIILITEWRQFRQVDFGELKLRMKQAILFDGRNQYSTNHMLKAGFEYYCIGRNCYVK